MYVTTPYIVPGRHVYTCIWYMYVYKVRTLYTVCVYGMHLSRDGHIDAVYYNLTFQF